MKQSTCLSDALSFCLTGGLNTPRSCCMRSIRAMMEGMTEWSGEKEMKGWELGGRPDPLPENEDDGLDDDNGLVEL